MLLIASGRYPTFSLYKSGSLVTKGTRQVLMHWIAPTENAAAGAALGKRLCHATELFGIAFYARLFS